MADVVCEQLHISIQLDEAASIGHGAAARASKRNSMAIQSILNPSVNDTDGELSLETTNLMIPALIKDGEYRKCSEYDRVCDGGPPSNKP